MAHNKSGAQSHNHFPWHHVIGFATSIILTLIALWVAMYTELSSTLKIVTIFIFGFIQAGLQLFMFMHVREGEDGGWNVINMLFAAFIAVVIALGSYWVMEFGVHLNHHH
ncbi:cytochrome aa3 quinol oxidase subunit IV [Metabacillus arenae]|uniref:Quinol oxidase subunit 4 n=1 Tax=Metabacillus arenae TaxID=2771434 RepID=A0A926NEG9_9BACI|nr:cytochrome aa3 quinol oxidase subunit IV [Metabacillus arenae]MBD1379751.1 cytochrome aa3 quinol oxidase subunit IV [Metabacillus arenae]